MTVTGLACDLTALTAHERLEQAETSRRLRVTLTGIDELADGYAVSLPATGEAIALAARFIDYERRCCPFIQFNLDVVPNGGPVRLRLTGRDGVKQFIQTEFLAPEGG
jgi:hypothetical protein